VAPCQGASCQVVAAHPCTAQAPQEAQSQAGHRQSLGRRDPPLARPWVPLGQAVAPWAPLACPWGVAAGQTCLVVAAGHQSYCRPEPVGGRCGRQGCRANRGVAVYVAKRRCMCAVAAPAPTEAPCCLSLRQTLAGHCECCCEAFCSCLGTTNHLTPLVTACVCKTNSIGTQQAPGCMSRACINISAACSLMHAHMH
jgi:hypothetical protein